MRSADGTTSGGSRPAKRNRRSAHEVLAVASRALVLEQVRAHRDGVDTTTLAARTGLHANTVRFHLDVLAEAELITVAADPAGKPGRPRLLFSPARMRPPAAPGRSGNSPHASPEASPQANSDGYALLAAVLIRHLGRSAPDPGAAAEAAGRSWTLHRPSAPAVRPAPGGTAAESGTHVVAAVTGLLADIGFAPETVRDRDGWRVLLHRCPFHDAAAEHPEIVCRLHLGLLQGAIDRLGWPGDSVRLQPFLAPGLCEAFVPLQALRPRPSR